MPPATHIPVLVEEVLAAFTPKAGERLLDATLGHGGHAARYLTATAPDGAVVGIDADPAALAVARERLKQWSGQVTFIQGNFSQLVELVREAEPGKTENRPFHHILFDLGIGSHQLADDTRGFSFTAAHNLSMRYGSPGGRDSTLPAAQIPALNRLQRQIGRLPDVGDILAGTSAEELADILWAYGEERFRGRIARALKEGPIPQSSQAMAERIAEAVPGYYRYGRLHPATRTFQALRVVVNRELEALTAALPQAWKLVVPGGKLAVISFHSLEDRIVKTTFKRLAAETKARILTKKTLRPTEAEIAVNPRARSGKLRVLQRDG